MNSLKINKHTFVTMVKHKNKAGSCFWDVKTTQTSLTMHVRAFPTSSINYSWNSSFLIFIMLTVKVCGLLALFKMDTFGSWPESLPWFRSVSVPTFNFQFRTKTCTQVALSSSPFVTPLSCSYAFSALELFFNIFLPSTQDFVRHPFSFLFHFQLKIFSSFP